MRPHLAHIQETIRRKDAAEEAGNEQKAYLDYRKKSQMALMWGHPKERVIEELEREAARIKEDIREGDSLYMQGVANAQKACIAAIALIISELKGEK